MLQLNQMWSKVVCNVEVFDQNFTTFLYLPICFKKPLWWEKSWKDKNTFESCCSGHWICLLLHWDLHILWWVQCNVCHSNLNNSQGGERCLFCLDLLAATFLQGKDCFRNHNLCFVLNCQSSRPTCGRSSPFHIIWLQGSSEDGWLPFPLRRPSHWAVGCWGHCLPPHRNQEESPPKVNNWLVH